jgi:hypothetical protein
MSKYSRFIIDTIASADEDAMLTVWQNITDDTDPGVCSLYSQDDEHVVQRSGMGFHGVPQWLCDVVESHPGDVVLREWNGPNSRMLTCTLRLRSDPHDKVAVRVYKNSDYYEPVLYKIDGTPKAHSQVFAHGVPRRGEIETGDVAAARVVKGLLDHPLVFDSAAARAHASRWEHAIDNGYRELNSKKRNTFDLLADTLLQHPQFPADGSLLSAEVMGVLRELDETERKYKDHYLTARDFRVLYVYEGAAQVFKPQFPYVAMKTLATCDEITSLRMHLLPDKYAEAIAILSMTNAKELVHDVGMKLANRTFLIEV